MIITIHGDNNENIVTVGSDATVESALNSRGYDRDSVDYSVEKSMREKIQELEQEVFEK